MKTIEEKAKAYDKVRKKIAIRFGSNVANEFFAEFAESEDEKVREELIKHLKEGAEGYEPAGGSSDYQRWLDWVEKQGQVKESTISQHENRTCEENGNSLTYKMEEQV